MYYRLNVVPITIPPLRERKEDIPLFATHFLQITNNKYNLHKKISEQAMKQLQQYSWPGNVRELENTIERLVVIGGKEIIDPEELNTFLPDMVCEHTKECEGESLKDILEKVEKEVLQKVLNEQKTTRKVAEVLKIDQSTVVKKLKKYHIQVKDKQ